MLELLLTVLLLVSPLISGQQSIVMTMIVRDEAVNLASNLALWTPFISYFIFMVDDRTTDGSVEAIGNILSGKRNFRCIPYHFDGFGPARTLSLSNAWDYYPNATHVWIADPDWKPDTTTIAVNELSMQADAFRFKIFDRNGFTTRQCDWLLRHRAGLEMKYNLHEVLAIGEAYSVQQTKWVVHEIEKPGSWHSSVGHGNSFSASRYLFDLDLLYKDLTIFGHDPHTHYYLGVTHEGYATAVLKANTSFDGTLRWHIEQSVRFLTLRATSLYAGGNNGEFLEERWGSMMILGTIEGQYQTDFTKAHYWLSMCRDFNTKQVECSIALIRLYITNGMMMPAVSEMFRTLGVVRENRIMLNFYQMWNCHLPQYAVKLLVHLGMNPTASSIPFDTNLAKYLLLVFHMTQDSQCHATVLDYKIDNTSLEQMDHLLSQHGLSVDGPSPQQLCDDRSLLQYIVMRKFELHPCENLRTFVNEQQICEDFTGAFVTSPFEDFQIMQKGEFIGAAVVPNIIHHVYGGDKSRLLDPSLNTYRVLFAEHFNPRMLYSLLGHLTAESSTSEYGTDGKPNPYRLNGLQHVQFTVLSSLSDVLLDIQHKIEHCFEEHHRQQKQKYPSIPSFSVRYMQVSIDEFMSSEVVQSGEMFDYIEYYDSVKRRTERTDRTEATLEQQMKNLHKLTRSGGILGFTFFPKNYHTDAVRQLLKHQNVTSQPPYSEEPKRLVEEYFRFHSLDNFLTDEPLMNYLAGNDMNKPTFSNRRVDTLMQSTGWSVASWTPIGYSHPFVELDHYSSKHFKALGVSEEDFVYSLLPTFRKTVYATPTLKSVSNSSMAQFGRPNLSSLLRSGQLDVPNITESDMVLTGANRSSLMAICKHIYIIDQVGNLGSTFQHGQELALKSQSLSLSFSPSLAGKAMTFSQTCLPYILAALPHLSNSPSLFDLFEVTNDLIRQGKLELDISLSERLLLSFIVFLEKLDMVTIIHDGSELIDFMAINHEPISLSDNVLAGNDNSVNSVSSADGEHSSGNVVKNINIVGESQLKPPVMPLAATKAAAVVNPPDGTAKPVANGVTPNNENGGNSLSLSSGLTDMMVKLDKMRKRGIPEHVITAAKEEYLAGQSQTIDSSADVSRQSNQAKPSKIMLQSQTEPPLSSVPSTSADSRSSKDALLEKMKDLKVQGASKNEMMGVKREYMSRISSYKGKSDIDMKVENVPFTDDTEILLEQKTIDKAPVAPSFSSGLKDMMVKLDKMRKRGIPEHVITAAKEEYLAGQSQTIDSSADVSRQSNQAKPSKIMLQSQTEPPLSSAAGKLEKEGEHKSPFDILDTIRSRPPVKKLDNVDLLAELHKIKLGGNSIDDETENPLERLKKQELSHRSKAAEGTTTSDPVTMISLPRSGSFVHGAQTKKVKGGAPMQLIKQGPHTHQTTAELLASHRNLECHQRGSLRDQDQCTNVSSKLGRHTSAIAQISDMKILFDIGQLRHIALKDVISGNNILNFVLPHIQRIKTVLDGDRYNANNGAPVTLEMSDYLKSGGILNRVIYLARDTSVDISAEDAEGSGSAIYDQVLSYLQSDLRSVKFKESGDADYLIMPQVLKNKHLRIMVNMLLCSTIWFDMTNGHMLASHSDDGLVFPMFNSLSQSLAQAISLGENSPFAVHKYFAVTMDLSSESPLTSPLIVGLPDELILVLWLNPASGAPPATDSDAAFDGIVLYEPITLECLEFYGVSSNHPDEYADDDTYHPDFMSDGHYLRRPSSHSSHSPLSINVTEMCPDIEYESILRGSNEMVVISPGRPFTFTTGGRGLYDDVKSFEHNTMLALVIVLKF